MEISPLEERIDELNHMKLALKKELAEVMEQESKDCKSLDE